MIAAKRLQQLGGVDLDCDHPDDESNRGLMQSSLTSYWQPAAFLHKSSPSARYFLGQGGMVIPCSVSEISKAYIEDLVINPTFNLSHFQSSLEPRQMDLDSCI